MKTPTVVFVARQTRPDSLRLVSRGRLSLLALCVLDERFRKKIRIFRFILRIEAMNREADTQWNEAVITAEVLAA